MESTRKLVVQILKKNELSSSWTNATRLESSCICCLRAEFELEELGLDSAHIKYNKKVYDLA